MSQLLEGARRRLGRGKDLADQVHGLEEVLEHARGRLDDDLIDDTERVVNRVGGRLRLSADHTVVALAGATGSGKSSTFNALAGRDLSRVGVRRPTTAWSSACVWGDDPAEEVLDWLEIPPRHRSRHDQPGETLQSDDLQDGAGRTGRRGREPDLQGLVLLDLPDHDSTEVSNHLEVERLVGLADLLVWVLDPQKYADAAIHRTYLRPMAGHADVMIVVLNHIDEVAPQRREGMLGDVRRLLEQDGLEGVPVLGISAREGEGIPELRALIAKRVAAKKSASTRLRTDVQECAERLDRANGRAAAPEPAGRTRAELSAAVADSAGVPVVVQAVERSTRARAGRATGWPPTAWLAKVRPDPLRRLHLDRGRSGAGSAHDSGNELVSAARTSLPVATEVQRSRVEGAVRRLANDVSEDLSAPWAAAVRRASTSSSADIADRVDAAVARTDLGKVGVPWWGRLFQVLQWVLLITALAGAGWLGLVALLSYLQLGDLAVPRVRGFPIPTLMLLGGAVAGLLLALAGRGLVRLSAKTRGRTAEKRLRESIDEVVEELVIQPIQAELAAYRSTREGIDRALG